MNTLLTPDVARIELLRNLIRLPLAEDDALLWMVLLHTHAIHLRSDALEKNGTPGSAAVLPAETRRGAAEVIAALWPDREDDRATYTYWYFLYNTRTPYEVMEDVPDGMRPRLLELRDLLAQEPRIVGVVQED